MYNLAHHNLIIKKDITTMKKILESIWIYLKDWRNWLSHGLVGVGILAVGLFLPVKPIYRIIILIIIIGFNIARMKLSEKKADESQALKSANN